MHPLWRLSLFMPLCVAAGSFFEARDRTCVVLANRGECSLDDKFIYAQAVHGEKVADPSALAQMRAQARKISLKTSLVAALLAILLTILPI